MNSLRSGLILQMSSDLIMVTQRRPQMPVDPNTTMTREIRRDIAKEVDKLMRTVRPARMVLTFDTHAIQVIIFPPSEGVFTVPGGPHTVMIRDGNVEE